MMRPIHILIAIGLIWVSLFASPAMAKPTQQDVFKSIQDNVGQTDDSSMRALPWVCGGIAVIILLAVVAKRQKNQAVPKTLNNPGKLIKEVMKVIPLKPREVKQLRIVSDQTHTDDGESLTNPLVLLLCPSVLIKTVNERSTRADRQTLIAVLKKMGIR
jgi:hypothetical protein